MGLDYEIIYKKGKENVVADGLSRQVSPIDIQDQCFEITKQNVSTLTPAWIQEIVESWNDDPGLMDIIVQLQLAPSSLPGFSFNNSRLKHNDKLVVGPVQELRLKFVQEFHNSAIGGHSVIRGTLERIQQFFWWPSLRKDIITFVRECTLGLYNLYLSQKSHGHISPWI